MLIGQELSPELQRSETSSLMSQLDWGNTINLIDQIMVVGDIVWEIFFKLLDYLISHMNNFLPNNAISQKCCQPPLT